MNAFINKIKDRAAEEFIDSADYMRLATESHNDGYAQILRDIAKEEYRHAMHLESILKDYGIVMTEDEENKEVENHTKEKSVSMMQTHNNSNTTSNSNMPINNRPINNNMQTNGTQPNNNANANSPQPKK
jgi:rubrerythrin